MAAAEATSTNSTAVRNPGFEELEKLNITKHPVPYLNGVRGGAACWKGLLGDDLGKY